MINYKAVITAKILFNGTSVSNSVIEKEGKQAGAEFGQAQQLVFQIWGCFGFLLSKTG